MSKKLPRRNCLYCGLLLDRPEKYYCNTSHKGLQYAKERYLADPNSVGPRSVKTYLIATRGRKCESCGLDKWLGKEIPLELDHITGDWQNHSQDNVRLLCPNCHAQTPTYKNKNKGKGRIGR